MWIEEMRSMLQKHLPERAFLRRDRGDNLFVSNAPVFDPGITSIPGFILCREGHLLHILPDESWIARIEGSGIAPDHLAATLLRFRGNTTDRENLLLFARGCKLLDEGSPSPNDIEAYDRSLRQRAAAALRGECGGGLYACAVLAIRLRETSL